MSPETVRASDLAEFLVQFEKAILETVIARKDLPEAAMRDLTVSLIAIQSGSECLTFALTGEVMFGAGLLSKAHSTSDYSQIPTRAHDALHRISSQAVKNSWTVEFVEDRYNNIRSAIISQEHPVPPPRIVTAKGDTTIYGRLIRVGGVRPRGMLALSDGSYLYIDLTEAMARSACLQGTTLQGCWH